MFPEHQNWFGMDENLGPVAVSIKREKVEDTGGSENSQPQYIYRLIVRTSEVSAQTEKSRRRNEQTITDIIDGFSIVHFYYGRTFLKEWAAYSVLWDVTP